MAAALSTAIPLILTSLLLLFLFTQVSYFKSAKEFNGHIISPNERPFQPQVQPNATTKWKFDFARLTFDWSDCSDASNPLGTISAISIAPDPLVVPGYISLLLAGSLRRPIISPVPFHLRIKKKVGLFWVPVPCEGAVGSCDYEDFCLKWPLPGPECPRVYQEHGIPCECPFSVGNYSLPLSNVGFVNPGPLPSWLEKGEYKVRAWLSESQTDLGLCIDLRLNIRPA